MGPFKHTVDDGLDLRKAAFECMYTLLDSCLDRLDVFEFLNHVESGLRDHYDIKMLTYLMTARLAQLCPTAVLQSKLIWHLFSSGLIWLVLIGKWWWRYWKIQHTKVERFNGFVMNLKITPLSIIKFGKASIFYFEFLIIFIT